MSALVKDKKEDQSEAAAVAYKFLIDLIEHEWVSKSYAKRVEGLRTEMDELKTIYT